MNEEKITEEKRSCKNCLYYLRYDNVCINYNPKSSNPLIPSKRTEACIDWVDKAKGSDGIPF